MPDERDVRRVYPRPASVASQTAAPEPVYDDLTGKYEGEELARMRARRPTPERLSRLESKDDKQDERHEALSKTVTEIRVDVGEIKGKLELLPKLVDDVRAGLAAFAQRDHLAFKAHLDIETAETKAEISDKLDARKARRKWITKIVTALIGAAFSGAVIHWLLGQM